MLRKFVKPKKHCQNNSDTEHLLSLFRIRSMCCNSEVETSPFSEAKYNKGGKIMASSSDGPQRHRNVEVVAEKAGHCRVAKAV